MEQNIVFVYYCNALDKKGEPDKESTEQQWFDLNALPNLEETAFDHLQILNAFLNNKDVFVEKPMTLNIKDSIELVEIAKKQMCLQTRTGIELWIDEDDAKKVFASLNGGGKFVVIEGRLFNSADVWPGEFIGCD